MIQLSIPGIACRPASGVRIGLAFVVAVASIAISTSAQAVDGCTVLLCLAAPKWSAIPQCVPPVVELFKELAHGHAFPACSMGDDSGNTGVNNAWTQAPLLCPPQYTHLLDADPGPLYACDYSGVVSVVIDGTLFTRTWWTFDGQTVTEFTPAAKAQLGAWDPTFDNDYAAWSASQPPAAPVDLH